MIYLYSTPTTKHWLPKIFEAKLRNLMSSATFEVISTLSEPDISSFSICSNVEIFPPVVKGTKQLMAQFLTTLLKKISVSFLFSEILISINSSAS